MLLLSRSSMAASLAASQPTAFPNFVTIHCARQYFGSLPTFHVCRVPSFGLAVCLPNLRFETEHFVLGEPGRVVHQLPLNRVESVNDADFGAELIVHLVVNAAIASGPRPAHELAGAEAAVAQDMVR